MAHSYVLATVGTQEMELKPVKVRIMIIISKSLVIVFQISMSALLILVPRMPPVKMQMAHSYVLATVGTQEMELKTVKVRIMIIISKSLVIVFQISMSALLTLVPRMPPVKMQMAHSYVLATVGTQEMELKPVKVRIMIIISKSLVIVFQISMSALLILVPRMPPVKM